MFQRSWDGNKLELAEEALFQCYLNGRKARSKLYFCLGFLIDSIVYILFIGKELEF